MYNYKNGITPIQNKTKEVRPEINNIINENRAYEIVNFENGYCFGEPIQYIRRGKDESLTDDIDLLNDYMFSINKDSSDKELGEWMHICGVGYRICLPTKEDEFSATGDPLKSYVLDPRYSFVVRYNGLGNPIVMGVKYIVKDDNTKVYSVYTKNWYYQIEGAILQINWNESKPHALGMVPIIEYPLDNARLGSFEIVLPMLDAINTLQSNRLDDVQQFVNSFIAIFGATVDDEIIAKLNEWKLLCIPDGADIKVISEQLKQADIQTLKDDLYQAVLTICGIPNRNGGSSTSDTGSAVIMRDGWEAAEARAKATEAIFKSSEREFLKLVLKILADTVGTNLTIKDINIKFTRRNYEAIQTKSQVLTTMLANEKIHPELAFTHCGMFQDPETAYLQSKAYYEANQIVEQPPPTRTGGAAV